MVHLYDRIWYWFKNTFAPSPYGKSNPPTIDECKKWSGFGR